MIKRKFVRYETVPSEPDDLMCFGLVGGPLTTTWCWPEAQAQHASIALIAGITEGVVIAGDVIYLEFGPWNIEASRDGLVLVESNGQRLPFSSWGGILDYMKAPVLQFDTPT